MVRVKLSSFLRIRTFSPCIRTIRACECVIWPGRHRHSTCYPFVLVQRASASVGICAGIVGMPDDDFRDVSQSVRSPQATLAVGLHQPLAVFWRSCPDDAHRLRPCRARRPVASLAEVRWRGGRRGRCRAPPLPPAMHTPSAELAVRTDATGLPASKSRFVRGIPPSKGRFMSPNRRGSYLGLVLCAHGCDWGIALTNHIFRLVPFAIVASIVVSHTIACTANIPGYQGSG